MALNIAKLQERRADLIKRRARLLEQHKSCEAIDWRLAQITVNVLKWELKHYVDKLNKEQATA